MCQHALHMKIQHEKWASSWAGVIVVGYICFKKYQIPGCVMSHASYSYDKSVSIIWVHFCSVIYRVAVMFCFPCDYSKTISADTSVPAMSLCAHSSSRCRQRDQ